MAVTHTMAFSDKIQMRIDLHQMKRVLPGKGVDAGDVHRMITAKHNRHRTRRQNGAHTGLDVRMAFHGIGMDNVGITDIDNAHLVIFQIGDVILMVIGTGMAE